MSDAIWAIVAVASLIGGTVATLLGVRLGYRIGRQEPLPNRVDQAPGEFEMLDRRDRQAVAQEDDEEDDDPDLERLT